MSQLFREQYRRSREIRDLATGRTEVPANVHIATLCTTGVENVDRIWSTPQQLREAALSYGKRVLELFVKTPTDWTLPDDCGTAEETMIQA